MRRHEDGECHKGNFSPISLLLELEMGLEKKSKVFEMPRSTLKDEVNSMETDLVGNQCCPTISMKNLSVTV